MKWLWEKEKDHGESGTDVFVPRLGSELDERVKVVTRGRDEGVFGWSHAEVKVVLCDCTESE
jgi:hypothetical protein